MWPHIYLSMYKPCIKKHCLGCVSKLDEWKVVTVQDYCEYTITPILLSSRLSFTTRFYQYQYCLVEYCLFTIILSIVPSLLHTYIHILIIYNHSIILHAIIYVAMYTLLHEFGSHIINVQLWPDGPVVFPCKIWLNNNFWHNLD